MATIEQLRVAAPLTLVSSTPYTVKVLDEILQCDTSVALTLNLPAASSVTAGRRYYIKDATGNAEINNITVTPDGFDTIDGDNTLIIQANYAGVAIYCDGVSAWFII